MSDNSAVKTERPAGALSWFQSARISPQMLQDGQIQPGLLFVEAKAAEIRFSERKVKTKAF